MVILCQGLVLQKGWSYKVHTHLQSRLLEKSKGRILAQRSTGTDDGRMAAAKAGQFLVELPLAKLAQAKSAQDQEGYEGAKRLRNMDLASFFTWFWTTGASDYIQDRIDAEKPLSNFNLLGPPLHEPIGSPF